MNYYGECCFYIAKIFGCENTFEYLYNNSNKFYYRFTFDDIIDAYNNGYYIITKILIADSINIYYNNNIFSFFCEENDYDICVFMKRNFSNINHKLVDLAKIKNAEIIEWIEMDCPIRQTSIKSSGKIIC